MALTALAIPSQVGQFPAPYDALLELSPVETITATAYFGAAVATKTLDLGGSTPVSAVGRTDGIWNILISAADMASTDETYRAHLFGSNDVAFGNGNVELLAYHDLAAVTAGRQVATILGATPTIPPTNVTGTLLQIPFTNLMQRILYRYVRGYWVIGGTTPSITYRSWLSRAQIDV